jgi:hypothetical protein
MMVVSWPCKVLSEIDVNGRRVSEPDRKDKGKATVPESKDGKDQENMHGAIQGLRGGSIGLLKAVR